MQRVHCEAGETCSKPVEKGKIGNYCLGNYCLITQAASSTRILITRISFYACLIKLASGICIGRESGDEFYCFMRGQEEAGREGEREEERKKGTNSLDQC